ncbi:MAG: DUF3781 domain-containing protein [Rickettsiales bacterium]|jgi:hypothetical protein|nr:DUF3781 domain-containing protein [Rickettsiales bacterium]
MDIAQTLIDNLHTTTMGAQRVRRNMKLDSSLDVSRWAQRLIANAPRDAITRRGKNWYVIYNKNILTINARTYTLITAHNTEK